MKDLSADDRSDKYISHALQVRAAAQLGNYCAFFRLYSDAPGHSGYVMDTFIGRERFAALRRICRAYQPSVPLAAVSDALAFDDAAECGEWAEDSFMAWPPPSVTHSLSCPARVQQSALPPAHSSAAGARKMTNHRPADELDRDLSAAPERGPDGGTLDVRTTRYVWFHTWQVQTCDHDSEPLGRLASAR